MRKNIVYDYIIELVDSIKKDDSIRFGNERWTGSTYILGQIIRQYCIPQEHFFVSKKAKELWDILSNDNIFYYWYQCKVKCCCDEAEIKEFSGNRKSFRKRIIHRDETFVYRSVFHDEHVVPVNVIIKELCSFSPLTYDCIQKTLSKIRICKMLKEEDKLIPHKSNRSIDYQRALATDYQSVGIEVYEVDQNGLLRPFKYPENEL